MAHADSRKPRTSFDTARLLVLCSPMNPAGTMISEAQMKAICDGVLEENRRRKSTGDALYVMYDQVYRMLAFDGREHLTPVGVAPEMQLTRSSPMRSASASEQRVCESAG